ncbi:MAG: phage baseplate assembly protein V [Fervidobacterium sp.]|nr:phage baseplate assembly protein V [Fervidobacterium sp.]
MYRVGIVVAIDEARAMVRVQWTDLDGELSYWLPVMQHKTLRDKAYWLPDVGEHVVCLLDENGEEGVVLGAIYSDADKPPVSSRDKFFVRFEDGTTIEYDRKSHTLNINCTGTVNITASAVNINSNVNLTGNLEVAGNIHATGSIIDEGGNTPHHSH